MLFSEIPAKLTDDNWQRINMRRVSHLIGAEMIHNLYQRHWPRINSLRFRNTITNFKDGNVESYAPVREWEYLKKWLAKRFINSDVVLIREIRAILNPDYAFIDEMLKSIDKTDLKKLSNDNLALSLINLMDFSLGEIYKLNVVQIEYGLNNALHTLLKKYEPSDVDRNDLLVKLIAPGKLTVAQTDEIEFSKIVKYGIKQKCSNPRTNENVSRKIVRHYQRYAPTYCAYGEEPPKLGVFEDKYREYYKKPQMLIGKASALRNVKEQQDSSRHYLSVINDTTINSLCELMAEIGTFRDHNKAKLGETVMRRLAIIDEIHRRTRVSRRHLDLYIMAELTELLSTGKEVAETIIDSRKINGVCFSRSEAVTSIVKTVKPSKVQNTDSGITGICASAGKITSKVKLVSKKEDITHVNSGDIMIAIGTDFDLLEIMCLSGGIITEEGGLLSHASVVSREMKKPCLIGVKNAVKIFHDEDIVELNATDGFVKLMSCTHRRRT